MAEYKQTKRLKTSKAISRKRIRRAQKSYDKIEQSKKAGMGIKAIADFGASMLGAAQSVQAATAPNETAWDSYEAGREEVGLERTDSDLGFFEKLGRKLKGPDLSKKSVVVSDFDDPITGDAMTSSHIYSGAELSSIGKEVISGTAQQTLNKANTENWSDIFGKKGPGGLKGVSSDGKATSMNNNVGKTLNSSVATTNTPPAQTTMNQPIKSVETNTSTTEAVPTESMADAWKSQYGSLDDAAVSRNRGETSFGKIDQYGINQALELGEGDWAKAGQMWGSDKWLEAMKRFNV